jgi:hypothetical protein
LGLRGSQAEVYHFMIRDSEIERQSETELGQRIWTMVFFSVNQVSEIVISEYFFEIEIERYTECWFSQVGFPG